jgi:nucleoside-diphosphate-sugar epimerase
MRPRKPSIMVTGASGYIGRLIAATLLEREPQTTTILAPVRANHDHAKLRSLIADELPTRDADVRARMLDRLVFLPLPPTGSFATQLVPHLLQALNEYELVSVVHVAGCLSYFNEAKLREGNEELTTLMLELARTLGVGMFVYLSTAFCSGYQNEPIPRGSPRRSAIRSERVHQVQTSHRVDRGVEWCPVPDPPALGRGWPEHRRVLLGKALRGLPALDRPLPLPL